MNKLKENELNELIISYNNSENDELILDVIEKLKSTKKTNEKIDILSKHEDNDLLKFMMYMAVDCHMIYGIKFDTSHEFNDEDHEYIENLANALLEMKRMLTTRNKTGNEAREWFESLLMKTSKPIAKLLIGVLNKDLECGVSTKLVNKVWKGLISEQPHMLARSMNDKNLSKIKYPCIIQLKADGARCLAIGNHKGVSLISRNSSIYMGLNDIEESVRLMFKNIMENYTENLDCDEYFIMDGELILAKDEVDIENRQTGNGILNKSIKNTITPEESKLVRFQVWDLYSDRVENGIVKSKPYDERFELLKEVVGEDCVYINTIESQVINDIDEAMDIFQHYLDMGMEGAILKNIKGLWKNTRSPDQVKLKDFKTGDFKVVGYKEHKKDSSKIGSLTIESSCGIINCDVGTGFKDKQYDLDGNKIPFEELHEYDRHRLLTIVDDLVRNETIIEVKYNDIVDNELRTNENGGFYKSLYLPVFVGIRYDKNEANSLEEL